MTRDASTSATQVVRSVWLGTMGLVLAACGGGGAGDEIVPGVGLSDNPVPMTGDPTSPPSTPPPTSTPPSTPTPPATPPSSPQTGSPPPPVASSTKLDDARDVSEFYVKAGFGATNAQLTADVGRDAADLIAAEFAKPRRAYTPRVRRLYESQESHQLRSHGTVFWSDLISGDDVLRQRMVFALSQILVVSDKSDLGDKPMQISAYMDLLGQHAFGNYRDLLEAVTYNPAMGEYLTFRGNRKGDPRTGRLPDENYAREILQLFTIGLVELNMDGTPRLQGGKPIETYGNADIMGLARVFTGLDLAPASNPSYDPASPRRERPMVIEEQHHSDREKSFLGTTIPAGTPAAQSIDQALDAIFDHPNVAPFVSRQLIQRFTASHPEPSYVRRVANAFESGSFTAPNGRRFGEGRRGDLQATLAAILLDESQHRDPGTPRDTTDLGKVREPVLNFVHWARAMEVAPVTPGNEWMLLYNAGNTADWMGQMPMGSPSVFNHYRPGYVAMNTEAGGRDLTVPEFQILLNGNRSGYSNHMTEYAFDNTYGPDNGSNSFEPDYAPLYARVREPEQVADYLDRLLLGGDMQADTRATLVDGLEAIPIRGDDPVRAAQDESRRVSFAVAVAVTAPEFMVR